MAKSPGLDVIRLEFSGEQDGGALLVHIDQRGILFSRNGVDLFVSKNETRTIARHLDDGCGTVWRQDEVAATMASFDGPVEALRR